MTESLANILGVVLCGGQSSRMGTDKGLLKLEARTWAQTAMDKLTVFQIPVVISVNSTQYEQYPAVFPHELLIQDLDDLEIHGPLAGVLSVHKHFPDKDLLVLACDMPLMESAVVEILLSAYKMLLPAGGQSAEAGTIFIDRSNEASGPADGVDAFVFENKGEPEPLCGIYTARALSVTWQRYKERQLPRHSMKFLLQHVHTRLLPIPTGKENCFRNFNAHAELNGL